MGDNLYDEVEQSARDEYRWKPWDCGEDDYPSRRRHTTYRCADGMCGAYDCEKCHPGQRNQQREEEP